MNIMDWAEKDGRCYKKVSTHKGGEFHGPCPLCKGNDRFHLWPAQGEFGSFWCRTCDLGGDLIKYLRAYEGMSYHDACKTVGRDLPPQQEGRTPQLRRPA